MTNIDTTDNVQIDRTDIEKVTNYKCLEQTKSVDKRTKQEVLMRRKAGFCKVHRNISEQAFSHDYKRKGLPVAMTCGCQT